MYLPQQQKTLRRRFLMPRGLPVVMKETPRTSFASEKKRSEEMIVELLTHLNDRQIRRMEAAFGGCRVSLADFLNIVKEVLVSFMTENADATRTLTDLFEEVDVDGEESIKWEDFTRFLVEKARVFNDTNNTLRPYRRCQATALEEKSARHRHGVDKILTIPENHLFCVTEQHHPAVRLYDARTGQVQTVFKTSSVPLAMTYCRDSSPNDMILPKLNHGGQQKASSSNKGTSLSGHILVSCSDMTLASFSLSRDVHSKIVKAKEVARWPTPEALLCLCWSPSQRFAFSGDAKGIVSGWNKKEMVMRLKGHEDIVMDLCHLDFLDNIVSASLDGTVRIWDTSVEKESMCLRGHAKGVTALTYNAEDRFLISSGFDHDAYVWSPFVSTLLYKLKGHRSALVGCKAVEKTHELITADTQGYFKLWDLRTFQCVQTFSSQRDKTSLLEDSVLANFQTFTHMKIPPKDLCQDEPDCRLIAATKKLFFFDQVRLKKEAVTDAVPPRIVVFNERSLTVFCVSDQSINAWDAVLGTLKHTFQDIASADITALCLDGRRRKIFVGDANGQLLCHNEQNGAILKRFPPFLDTSDKKGHQRRQEQIPSDESLEKISGGKNCGVAALVYVSKRKALLAACANGSIWIYDERDPDICIALRRFEDSYAHKAEVCLMSLSQSERTAATASCASSEGVRLWNAETAKCEGIVKTEAAAALCIGFLDPHPFVYVCCADGTVAVYATGTAAGKLAGTCLLRFENVPPEGAAFETTEATEDRPANLPPAADDRPRLLPPAREQREGLPEGVSSLPTPAAAATFEKHTNQLILGDDTGNLRSYDMTQFITKVLRSGGEDDDDDDDECDLDALKDHGVLKPHELRGYEARRRQQSTSMPSSQEEAVLSVLLTEKDTKKEAPHSLLPSRWATFAWGSEAAHSEAILSVTTSSDPRAIFSAGLDRCLRMWDLRGFFRGILLQGLALGASNPCWSLDLNVAAREAAHRAKAEAVALRAREIKKPLVIPKVNDLKAYFADDDDDKSQVSYRSGLRVNEDQRSRVTKALSDASLLSTATAGAAGVVQKKKNNNNHAHMSSTSLLSSASTQDFPATRSVLSVVPPLPHIDRLSPEAQRSLDKLTIALSLAT